jgi:hypothetical protein
VRAAVAHAGARTSFSWFRMQAFRRVSFIAASNRHPAPQTRDNPLHR